MTDPSGFVGRGFTRLKDGRVMCSICFEYKERKDLAVDEDGDIYDVCKGKCAVESGLKEKQ